MLRFLRQAFFKTIQLRFAMFQLFFQCKSYTYKSQAHALLRETWFFSNTCCVFFPLFTCIIPVGAKTACVCLRSAGRKVVAGLPEDLDAATEQPAATCLGTRQYHVWAPKFSLKSGSWVRFFVTVTPHNFLFCVNGYPELHLRSTITR